MLQNYSCLRATTVGQPSEAVEPARRSGAVSPAATSVIGLPEIKRPPKTVCGYEGHGIVAVASFLALTDAGRGQSLGLFLVRNAVAGDLPSRADSR
jgi:hypothetical protein